MIRYGLAFILVSVFFLAPAYGDGEQPITAVQRGQESLLALSRDHDADGSVELMLTSQSEISRAAAPKGWNVSQDGPHSVSFQASGSVNGSILEVYTNSTAPAFDYSLVMGPQSLKDTLVPQASPEPVKYLSWTDSREGALSAFVPEGWKADLQIIRPYNSMTGFVFFARGENNSLAYVLAPFMPLHLLPDDNICSEFGGCGMVSGARADKASFGVAPVAVSALKDPGAYFESEVLPLLRANLEGYSVDTVAPVYALKYAGDNKPASVFYRGVQIDYSFDSDGQKSVGRAFVLMANQTVGRTGFWAGYVMGIESPADGFGRAFEKASVTLLTLHVNEKWAAKEQAVLDQSIASARPALANLTRAIANSTLKETASLVASGAHAMARSQKGATIGAYYDAKTGVEMHLPGYEWSRYWVLNDGRLEGRPARAAGGSEIELLYR